MTTNTNTNESTSTTPVQFHTPRKPFTFIDAYNRSAAAKGSPTYGVKTAGADYNGHQGEVVWNDYRRYYVASYRWAGQRVICRNADLAVVLTRALVWYKSQGLGAQIKVTPRPCDVGVLADLVSSGDLFEATPEATATDLAWHTWKHDIARSAAPDYSRPNTRRYVFDVDLLEASTSRDEYLDALRVKHGACMR